MAYEKIDLETPQPNGKVGEPLPTALARVRRMFVELYKLWQTNPNVFPYFDKDGNPTFSALTEFARSIMDDPDAATALKTLGLGTPGTLGKSMLATADVAAAQALLKLAFSASGARFGTAAQPLLSTTDLNGIMDIGKFLDFHESSADASDYSGRMFSNNGLPWWVNPNDGVGRTMFTQHNIVGAVGWSGNYPTGAVVERGGNANGIYTRFADGTQICRAVFDQNIAFGNPYASGFYGVFNWDFPAGFVTGQIPTVVYAAKPSGALCLTAGGIDPGDASTTRYTALPFAFVNQTMATRISLLAVGLWR